MVEDKGEPIPGPSAVGPDYLLAPDLEAHTSPVQAVGRKLLNFVRTPAHWIRENLIIPNRGPKYYWYHRKFERALPIDECYLDDLACIMEADIEHFRNLAVDRETLRLLRHRLDSCHYWNSTKHGELRRSENCDELADTYNREEINFFIKYGDMHYKASVLHAYNKQKHRMIMERRRALRAEQGDLPEGETS